MHPSRSARGHELNAREAGSRLEGDWTARLAAYRAAHPDLATEFERRIAGALPATFAEAGAALIRAQAAKSESVATRKASQQALEALGPVLPELIGGSADLTGSVLTNWSGSRTVTANASGNYVYFGVREFAMSAIANGLALHGGFIPYVGTFLTFSDYARNALRLAALMKLRTIFVYTHDSIGLGEDGPTHQPIEHAAALRLIPGMELWRPCDTVESAVAWIRAIERADGPTCLLFTRQNVPFQRRDEAQIEAIRRGGYVLADWHDERAAQRAVIIATGSEVALAIGARGAGGRASPCARLLPCTSVFDQRLMRTANEYCPPGRARSDQRACRITGENTSADGAVIVSHLPGRIGARGSIVCISATVENGRAVKRCHLGASA
jgi:transketolase